MDVLVPGRGRRGYIDGDSLDLSQPLAFTIDDVLSAEECAALIGPNGAGKTTFLKTLLGELAPLDGQVKLGSSLKVGYFAQAHEGLDPERTPLEEILRVIAVDEL